jgi:hypothetical protein
MTAERDVTRIVRSWLEEGATALPDRVLDAVLDQLPATPQRRASRPAWRFRDMNTSIKIALAAAVMTVAFLGLSIPILTTVQGPGASPSPLPRVITMVDSTSDLRLEWNLPPGWSVCCEGWALVKDSSDPPGDMAIAGTLVSGVYEDPCQWQTGTVSLPTDPTVEQTVAAIAAQPTRNASEVTDVTLGGYAGKHLTISVPTDAVFSDCAQGEFRSYHGRDGGIRFHQGPGQIDELWVLDVDGTTVTVGASYYPATSEADRAEQATVLDSLRVIAPEPPLAYTWPGPMGAGTYATRLVWDAPVELTFTVPDGWESRDTEIIKDPVSRSGEVGGSRGMSVMALPIGNVYADPCGHALHDPPVGYSVDEVASALASLPGVTASAPTPAELGGYSGTYLELSVPDSIPCASKDFFMWDAEEGSIPTYPTAPTGGSTGFSAERPNHRIWILDIDGLPYLVDAMSAADATPEDLAELQAVLDSIRIRWTADAASLGPCRIELTDPATGRVLEDPVTVTMGPDVFELWGPAPANENGDPLTPTPPLAQIDFTATGSGTGSSPGAPGLIGPAGRSAGPVPWDESRRGTGFSTGSAGAGPFQGSFVFDAPGKWLATIHPDRCLRQFPVEVLPPAG